MPDPRDSEIAESMIVLSETDTTPSSVKAGIKERRPIDESHLDGRPRWATRRYGVMALVAAVLVSGVAGFATGRTFVTRPSPPTDEGIRIVLVTDSSVPSEVITENGGLRFRQKLNVVNAGQDSFYLIDVRGRGNDVEIDGTTGIQEIKAGLATYVDINVAMSCEPRALNQTISVEVQVSSGTADAAPTTLHRFISLFTTSLSDWIEPHCGRFPEWSMVGVPS